MGLTGVGHSPNMLAGVHTCASSQAIDGNALPCGFQKPQKVKECRVLVLVQCMPSPIRKSPPLLTDAIGCYGTEQWPGSGLAKGQSPLWVKSSSVFNHHQKDS
jgi:hypothetical protein